MGLRYKRGPASWAKVKTAETTCAICGVLFPVRPLDLKRGRGRFCSRTCLGKNIPRRNTAGSGNPNWRGGVSGSSTEKGRRYRARYPEKETAHQAVRAALLSGKLTRLPCLRCGNDQAQAHHDDYLKPLDVMWLCKSHHLERHRDIKVTAQAWHRAL